MLATDPILDHLKLSPAPPAESFLGAILRAWAEHIPWESASRIARHQRARAAADYARPPSAFFTDALALGTGGTCFESNLALHSLLTMLGFEAALAFCDMEVQTVDPHCAVIVRLDGQRFLADVGYPIPGALLLNPDTRTAITTPVYEYSARPVAPERWQVQRRWDLAQDTPRLEHVVFWVKTQPVLPETFRTRLAADHQPDGLFLDEVIIQKTRGDYIWRFSERKGLVYRHAGREEPVPFEPGTDIPAQLARLFGMDARVIRAALDRRAPDAALWPELSR